MNGYSPCSHILPICTFTLCENTCENTHNGAWKQMENSMKKLPKKKDYDHYFF